MENTEMGKVVRGVTVSCVQNGHKLFAAATCRIVIIYSMNA